jgi:hypothetical protein
MKHHAMRRADRRRRLPFCRATQRGPSISKRWHRARGRLSARYGNISFNSYHIQVAPLFKSNRIDSNVSNCSVRTQLKPPLWPLIHNATPVALFDPIFHRHLWSFYRRLLQTHRNRLRSFFYLKPKPGELIKCRMQPSGWSPNASRGGGRSVDILVLFGCRLVASSSSRMIPREEHGRLHCA